MLLDLCTVVIPIECCYAAAGAFLSHGKEVLSSPQSYDEDLARLLWNASADVLKLPH